MHKRHTITKFRLSAGQFQMLLRAESEVGRRIHDPRPIYNPSEGVVNYHWTFRGHDRQIDSSLVEVLHEHLMSECAIGARG